MQPDHGGDIGRGLGGGLGDGGFDPLGRTCIDRIRETGRRHPRDRQVRGEGVDEAALVVAGRRRIRRPHREGTVRAAADLIAGTVPMIGMRGSNSARSAPSVCTLAVLQATTIASGSHCASELADARTTSVSLCAVSAP